MKKAFSMLVMSILACMVSLAGDINFKVNIHGTDYDSIRLAAYMGFTEHYDIIHGTKGVDRIWSFNIPDSVYERYCSFSMELNHADLIPYRTLLLWSKLGNDTLMSAVFCIAPHDNTLDISYVNSDTLRNQVFYRRKTAVKYNLMVNKMDEETEASLVNTTSNFGWFPDSSYNDDLVKYVELVKKYPYSHAFVSQLYESVRRFKTKTDIETVFRNFTKEQQRSYFGKKIQAYLNQTTFPNIRLPELSTNNMEDIIPQTGKSHLTVFTASWCFPCRKEIPMLKGIYAKYKDKLDITYVSVYDSATIKDMAKLMADEQIPWRCLYSNSTNIDNEVTKLYYLNGIPHVVLTDEDGVISREWMGYSEEHEKEIPAAIAKLLDEDK